MKLSKLIFSLVLSGIGLALVMIPALQISFQTEKYYSDKSIVLAQEKSENDVMPALQEEDRQDQDQEEVDYYLPYPGILPDHPLYWLKMIRDRARLWLTKNPTQRFQRLLLYADKRVGAAEALVEGGQSSLGVSTATKAEKYLEQTANQFKELKSLDKATPELKDSFFKASLKHEQVLKTILEKVPDQEKPTIEQILEIPRHNYEVVAD